DWANDIVEPLLRDDLKHCFAGNPSDRFVGAGQLAKNLYALPQRQASLQRHQAELVGREKATYRRGIIRAASLATMIVLLASGVAVVALRQSRTATMSALRESHELYGAKLN